MAIKLPFILARRFVAAEHLAGTLPVVKQLNERGLLVTLNLLGEYTDDRALAEESRDRYIKLLHTLADRRAQDGLQSSISIKMSLLGQQIDDAFCVDNLRQVLTVAKDHDIFIRVDMEGSDLTESTLALFEAVYPEYPDHVGIVLQAYLKRTAGDIQRMCDLKARVRLCKGAYKEPPDLAYQRMDDIRARFIEYMQELLLQGRYPGIATHDDQLITATKDFVTAREISQDRFEFQMLYGLRPETQLQLIQEGYPMRVYVPFGQRWRPYFTRRLLERKENIWFVAKNLLRK